VGGVGESQRARARSRHLRSTTETGSGRLYVKQMAARKAAKAAASGKGGLRAARSSAAVSAAAAGEDADGKAAETRHVCTVLAQAGKGS